MIVAVMLVAGALTANAAYMHTVTLKQGSTGPQVVSLQATLGGLVTDGSFGPMTKAAVMAFQTSKGLTADGVVGPMTGAALSGVMTGGSYPAGCSSTSGYSTTTGMPCSGGTTLPAGCSSTAGYSSTTGAKCDGSTTGTTTSPLTGGAGSITVDNLSTYSSEEVGEGESNVKVLAFTVEADDESDVDLSSVKVEFVESGATSSENLDDYADSVSVWMGSTKVGEADVSTFSENSDVWTKSISLSGAVVRAGDKETLTVAVSALDNLDSGDIDSDAWAVDVLNVRFEDADGVVTTEDTDGDTLDQSFDFTDFATSADVELKAALNDSDDEINLAHVIDVDDSDDTNDEPLLSFTLEAAGDSDIHLTQLPVLLTVVGPTNVDDMITNITLWHGNDEIASDSVGSAVGGTEVYTFEDLDVDIAAGDKEEFMVKVDLKSTGDVDLDNGDTIKAELDGTRVDLIEAEDEQGEDVGTGDLTGTALGEASAVYDTGITATFSSASETTTFSGDAAGEEDIAQFKVTFKVSSFDGDMRIDRSCEEAGADAAGQGIEYTLTGDDNDAPACSFTSSSTDSEDTSDTFEVDEGTTRTFTLTVSATGDDDASGDFISVAISSINWGTATDDTNANYYTFNLDEFKTDTLFVNSQ